MQQAINKNSLPFEVLPINSRENIPARRLGSMKGKIRMADDFDEPLDDFKEYM